MPCSANGGASRGRSTLASHSETFSVVHRSTSRGSDVGMDVPRGSSPPRNGGVGSVIIKPGGGFRPDARGEGVAPSRSGEPEPASGSLIRTRDPGSGATPARKSAREARREPEEIFMCLPGERTRDARRGDGPVPARRTVGGLEPASVSLLGAPRCVRGSATRSRCAFGRRRARGTSNRRFGQRGARKSRANKICTRAATTFSVSSSRARRRRRLALVVLDQPPTPRALGSTQSPPRGVLARGPSAARAWVR